MRIRESDIRRIFRIGLWLKAAHSVVELAGGLALAFLSHDWIVGLATSLTRVELIEDPHDIVANVVRHAADGFTGDAQSFAAWYLFSHGLIKLLLVGAVLANRIWAYPVFIAATIGFILYQLYRLSIAVTLPLLALTVLDLVVLVLVWHEYRLARRERQQPDSA